MFSYPSVTFLPVILSAYLISKSFSFAVVFTPSGVTFLILLNNALAKVCAFPSKTNGVSLSSITSFTFPSKSVSTFAAYLSVTSNPLLS